MRDNREEKDKLEELNRLRSKLEEKVGEKNELKNELKKKEEELNDLEEEVRGLLFKKDRDKIAFGRDRLKNTFENLAEDDQILIEERDEKDMTVVDVYLMFEDDLGYLGSLPSVLSTDSRQELPREWNKLVENVKSDHFVIDSNRDYLTGSIRFIHDELDPIEEHTHHGCLTHRTWEVTGRELLALKMLILNTDLEKRYEKEGWQEVKNYLDELRVNSKWSYVTPFSVDLDLVEDYDGATKEKILDYMVENEVTFEDAIENLKREYEGFKERYEKNKSKIQEKIERAESFFEPYIGS